MSTKTKIKGKDPIKSNFMECSRVLKPKLLKQLPILDEFGDEVGHFSIYLSTHHKHRNLIGHHHNLPKTMTEQEIETYVNEFVEYDPNGAIDGCINNGFDKIVLHPTCFLRIVD